MIHFAPPVCEPPSAIVTARNFFEKVYSVPTPAEAIVTLTQSADALRMADTPAARETVEVVTALIADLSVWGETENPLRIGGVREASRAEALASVISSRFGTMERTWGTGPALIPFKPRRFTR